MNFYLIITAGSAFVGILLTYFTLRDRKNPAVFFGQHKNLATVAIVFLLCGIALSTDVIVEPYFLIRRDVKIKIEGLSKPLRVVFVSDIQVGAYKFSGWTDRVAKKIAEANPDLVLIGGDLISNEGGDESEVNDLSPLIQITKKIPTYYVLGNHEYGTSRFGNGKFIRIANRVDIVEKKMSEMGASLLKNDLACPKISGEKICLFGLDDVYNILLNHDNKTDFEKLKNWDKKTPLIYLTHNPEGIYYWPKDIKKPEITLSGHTHGGQLRLPFIGPLVNPGIKMAKKYYKGLNDWNGFPIYTSAGTGESGGPIRLFNWPEIVAIELMP